MKIKLCQFLLVFYRIVEESFKFKGFLSAPCLEQNVKRESYPSVVISFWIFRIFAILTSAQHSKWTLLVVAVLGWVSLTLPNLNLFGFLYLRQKNETKIYHHILLRHIEIVLQFYLVRFPVAGYR